MNAGALVAMLSRELAGQTPALSTTRKARYGKEFKEQLESGVEGAVLEEAVGRIVERWPDWQLSVDEAVRDNGSRNTKQNGSRAPVTSLAELRNDPQLRGWNPERESIAAFLGRTLTREERAARRISQIESLGYKC